MQDKKNLHHNMSIVIYANRMLAIGAKTPITVQLIPIATKGIDMVTAQNIINYMNQCALMDQPATLDREKCIILMAEFNALNHTIDALEKTNRASKDAHLSIVKEERLLDPTHHYE